MERILSAAAIVVLIAFLAILVLNVPRLDLAGVVGAGVLLAIWDAVLGMRGPRGGRRRRGRGRPEA